MQKKSEIFRVIILMTSLIAFSGCDLIVITPMPQFQQYEYCPSVFQDIEPDSNIYKIDCRCAFFDPNTQKRVSEFVKSDISKCERAHAITLEDFESKFKPDLKELKAWYADEVKKSDKRVKLLKKYKKNK